MENPNKPSTARIALRYGLYTALGLTIYTIIIQLAGLATNPAMGIVGFFITAAILILGIVGGMREFRQQNEGYMSYGQGLGLGSLLAAVTGLISGVFTFFYLTFIDDSSLRVAMDAQREQMEARGMSDAEIDQAMAIAQRFASPGMTVFWSVLMMLFIGFILSLIISAIMKKERNPVETF
jgi:hypothetical protein